ncbi:efflux RND transporter permease subunit [Planctomyces sp. SH-PL62]|uniref:efflux RND transporter permease subunit n=1 Tax=Planctomyces sp. SH-PL62 TaxID=1636152 RepID=UPI00078EC0B8|nr:efflux RND transporter permease subunit [Planctomyces sp. SH-PL62]AMV36606.1 Multidrug efflux pump subunit AcrB [Planctomyces sp. SH-PL62]
MFTRFFIDRPIFASVISIVITLAGALSLYSLPVAMFPQIAPPTVMVSCQYPGANAQVVSDTVASPIEQKVNGVDDMMYMSSQSTNDGNYTLTVTFKQGVDLNLAQVLVQNRVALAVPMLPDVIKATGVTTRKRSPDILLSIGLFSPDARYDQLYLSNYALMHIREEMARLPGISDVGVLGTRNYSMRIWLDPDKLAMRELNAGDVVAALREQNAQVAAGSVGQSSEAGGSRTQFTIDTLGRLEDVDQFGDVIVKRTRDGRVVRIRDLGEIELGARSLDIDSEINGQPVANMAVFMLPDSNALETADVVRAKIAELKQDFPEGLDYVIRYDTTPYIRESIQEVFKTLMDSVVLVALVVLLFLQNWRSALIPLVAVPVGIVGTFAVMLGMGFSLNNLTLFGLVLAIGIVVDDAIVVVEAVEHHIERGLTPRAATIQAMSEVSSPVVAVGLVLTAVFIPCAFISGITGQFFRQFALTIASATILSTINSLTLSPALAAMLLKPRGKGEYQALPRFVLAGIGAWLGYTSLSPRLLPYFERAGAEAVHRASVLDSAGDLMLRLGASPEQAAEAVAAVIGGLALWTFAGPLNFVLGRFFTLFNRGFLATAGLYSRLVGGLLRVFMLVFAVYAGLLFLTYDTFIKTPRGFVPSQDMGYMLTNIQLPDSSSLERTRATLRKIAAIVREEPGVASTVAISGQSLLLSAFGSNFGTMFVTLEPFSKRRTNDLYYEVIMNKLRGKLAAAVPEANVSMFGPPPIRGAGRAGGWMLMVEDRGDLGPARLQREIERLVALANVSPTNPGIDVDGDPIPPEDAAKSEAAEKPKAAGGGFRAWIEGLTGGGSAGRSPAVDGLTSVFRANVPQIFLDVDRDACLVKGVPLRDVFQTLQAYLGSLYVNDFNLFGRTWQVVVQALPRYRDQKEDISRLQVRNDRGTMVPIGAVARVEEINGPLILTRYNMYPAASINGSAVPGVSSGTAIRAMERLAQRELPDAMSFEWTELAFLEQQAGNTALYVFGFSIAMVFLVLAAQFESWSMPLAVILSVPLCMLSAVVGVRNSAALGVHNAGTDINIFTQVGLVVLVGLASKNAILIVQFAKLIHNQGRSIREATLEACRLRLRPIIMTSMAFILGVVPLLYAHGAGSEMRKSLGVAVFSGMLGVTLFGIVLTPVFFYVIDSTSESRFFSSPWVRFLGRTTLDVLTLRILWRPAWTLTMRGAAAVRPRRKKPHHEPTDET